MSTVKQAGWDDILAAIKGAFKGDKLRQASHMTEESQRIKPFVEELANSISQRGLDQNIGLFYSPVTRKVRPVGPNRYSYENVVEGSGAPLSRKYTQRGVVSGDLLTPYEREAIRTTSKTVGKSGPFEVETALPSLDWALRRMGELSPEDIAKIRNRGLLETGAAYGGTAALGGAGVYGLSRLNKEASSMSFFDRVQMLKTASCMGEKPVEDETNHVGCDDVEMEKDDGDIISKIIPGHQAAEGSYKMKSTKITGVKKDDSPMVMKVVSKTSGGPIGESNDEDGPATVRVGEDSVESLGRALKILEQLKF